MADSYIEDKMAKVRAAKKPAEYKNIHPAVKDLDDDHPASLKIVKEWERHNRTLIKELRYKWRRMEKGKEKEKKGEEGGEKEKKGEKRKTDVSELIENNKVSKIGAKYSSI